MTTISKMTDDELIRTISNFGATIEEMQDADTRDALLQAREVYWDEIRHRLRQPAMVWREAETHFIFSAESASGGWKSPVKRTFTHAANWCHTMALEAETQNGR